MAQPIDSGSKAIGSTIHATTGGPDGTRLVVTVMLGGKPYPATLKLSSGEMGLVTLGSNFVQGNYASYDPTGTKIVYIGASGNTVEMINPDADVGYLFVSSATGMSSPRVSPDGSKIAFTKVVAGNLDIYVYTVATGTIKRLTTYAGHDGGPTWSPDG